MATSTVGTDAWPVCSSGVRRTRPTVVNRRGLSSSFPLSIRRGATRDANSGQGMSENPNTRANWERKFRQRLRSGWFRKPRYRRLSFVFRRWAMETKIRKTYHYPVADVAEGRFLDLGCGLGSCAALRGYLKGGFNVGVDFAFPGLRYALSECQRLGIPSRFVVGDGYRLPFCGGAFDSVYIGQVLEHLDDEVAVLLEALRVLRPGGFLVVSVPKGTACSGGDADHVNFYHTETDCRQLLQGLPVADVVFHPFHRHRFFFAARRAGSSAGQANPTVSH